MARGFRRHHNTIDLDSHFNLHPDPCRGPQLVDGVVLPPDTPGHGAEVIGGFDGGNIDNGGNESKDSDGDRAAPC